MIDFIKNYILMKKIKKRTTTSEYTRLLSDIRYYNVEHQELASEETTMDIHARCVFLEALRKSIEMRFNEYVEREKIK